MNLKKYTWYPLDLVAHVPSPTRKVEGLDFELKVELPEGFENLLFYFPEHFQVIQGYVVLDFMEVYVWVDHSSEGQGEISGEYEPKEGATHFMIIDIPDPVVKTKTDD